MVQKVILSSKLALPKTLSGRVQFLVTMDSRVGMSLGSNMTMSCSATRARSPTESLRVLAVCQDMDFSKNYEVKLEERSLEMFLRIG